MYTRCMSTRHYLPDCLLQSMRPLSHIGLILHGPIAAVWWGCACVGQHENAVEPHGCSNRVGDCSQDWNVALITAHLCQEGMRSK